MCALLYDKSLTIISRNQDGIKKDSRLSLVELPTRLEPAEIIIIISILPLNKELYLFSCLVNYTLSTFYKYYIKNF